MEIPENSKTREPQNTIEQFASLAAVKPGQAAFYILFASAFYFAAFMGAGSLISFLFGFSFWPCVGLVFLLRLCFT